MTNAEIVATDDGRPIKHISELNAVGRARADQAIRDALLAIVAAQGKAVSIPVADLDAISQAYRLKLEIDDKFVTLTAAKVVLIERA